jgi:dihydroneopterin triphosphate diphosphatase
MKRAPFQILVLPFRKKSDGTFEFASFRRADAGYWQAIAGGGDMGETPREAAIRESQEEASLSTTANYYELQSVDSVPRNIFAGADHWSPEIYVIPQYTFGVDCEDQEIILSHEHTEFQWATYAKIRDQFHWDSNKVALWELNERLQDGTLPKPFQ